MGEEGLKQSYKGQRYTILIVAHQFPPAGGIGVQRILRFVRDFPSHGWEPVVLTSCGRDYPQQDPSLLETLKPKPRIIRVDLHPSLWKLMPKLKPLSINGRQTTLQRIGYHLWIYDDFYPWIPFAIHHGMKILQTLHPDVVFASGNPFCSLIVAHQLAHRYALPLMVDFRDGWHGCEYRRRRGRFPRWLEAKLENIIIKDCHKAFFVTQGLLDYYNSKYPAYAHKFVWLPNGYNRHNPFLSSPSLTENNGHLSVKYIGKFTHYRRPDSFLKALNRAIYDLGCDNIEVEFIGGLDSDARKLIENMGLSRHVKITDFVSHTKALQLMSRADVLLLIVDRGPAYHIIQTGKIFEYMSSRRPILCVSPLDSEAAKTVKQESLGEVIEPEDEVGIAKMLKRWAEEKAKRRLISYHRRNLPETYDQKRISSYLASCLIESLGVP